MLTPSHSFIRRCARAELIRVLRGLHPIFLLAMMLTLVASLMGAIPTPAKAAGPLNVLFIDADRGLSGNTTWTNTLTALGINYAYEAIPANGDPTSNLSNYNVVIWSNGDQAYDNLTSTNVTLLTAYLDGGGNLLYAGGHNVYSESAADSFIQTYLGLTNFTYSMPSFQNDADPAFADGTGHPITSNNLYSFHTWPDGYYGGTMWSSFTPGLPTAQSLLMPRSTNLSLAGISNESIAALNDTPTYNTATWGFDLNNLDPQFRNQLLGDTLTVLTGGTIGDTTAPTVSAFTAASPSSSLNIPITTFTASDNTAVTGYLITTTSTQPSAGAAGWSGTAPSTYTVGAGGTYTLYPWARDAAGNVSSVYGSPASVTADTAPTISDITNQTTNEDTPTGAIDFAIGDAETAAGSLTVTGSSSNQALVPDANIVFGGSGANRTVIITPAANQNGSATITITVSDGITSTSDTFVLTMSSVNDAPVASDGSLTTAEDTPASGTLSASDLDGDVLIYSLVANGSQGVATITDPATGTFTYTPNANANGSDSFTFQALDDTALDFDGVNDYASTPLDGTALTQVTVEMWVKPSAVANAGIFQWSHALGADTPYIYFYDNGSSFTLYADNNYLLNTPLPRDQWTHMAATYDGSSWRLYKDGVLIGTYTGGTSNQPNAQSLYFGHGYAGFWNGQIDEARVWNVARTQAEIQGAMSASLVGNEAGLITYYQFNDGPGSASAANAASGGPVATLIDMDPANDWVPSLFGALSNIATVNVTITEVNDAPTGTDDSLSDVAEDSGSRIIPFSTPLGNDQTGPANESAQTLTITSVGSAVGGTVSIVGTDVIFTPAADYSGPGAFSYTLQDDGTTNGAADPRTATANVTFMITAVNDAPVASDGSLTTNEDTFASGTLSASDVESDPLTFSIITNGTQGVASITDAATGAYTYTPNANANGSDSFTFQVNDGTLDSNIATVSITITPVNDAPTASDGSLTTNEDTPASGTLVAADVDGNLLVYSIVTNGTKGVATITDAATGAYTYTPNANANGADSFTFKANDGTLNSNIATISITVTPVNDAPIASDGSLTTTEDTPASGTLSASDMDGDSLTYSLVANGSQGSASVNADGSYTYTPNPNANGADSFTFKANDGTADSNIATVSVTITPINDAPTLDLIADASVLESAPTQTVGLSGIGVGPTDETGQTLTVTATSSNPALIANPTVTYTSPNATGTLSFTPAAGLSGSATITVTVTDSSSGIEPNANTFTRTFVVFVGAVNNRPAIDQPADVTILEDSAAQSVNLTGIDVGSSAETGQSLTVTAVSSTPALIANPIVTYNSPQATGTLSYQPVVNASGTTTITVTVRDDGGTLNGGIDVVERVFTINVTPVNDAPDFTTGANQTVTATAGPQTLAGWVTGFTPGPADESSQTLLGYTVESNSNPALFDVAPAVAANGTLTYTPGQGAGGTATIGVTVRDSGGTANGGVDTSTVKTFTITVGPGYRVYLPLMGRVGAPDLVVTSISLSPNKTSFSAGEPVEITVVVENRGDQAAGSFWVDLSINPDQPPSAANQPWHQHCTLKPCFGLVWGVAELAPGASITLTSKQLPVGYSIWPGWLAAGTTDLYAYVDTYNEGVARGAVAERDEANNQFHLGGLTVTGSNPPLVGLRSVADLRQRPVRFQ
jgi:VCBS repeat-containing protein